MLRRLLLALALVGVVAVRAAAPEAIIVTISDHHSAYDGFAVFVARLDALKRHHPGVPLAILVNGDAFEQGNTVARRTAGELDFKFFAALAQRGPTVLNFGNHDADLLDLPETIARLQQLGVTVLFGNARSRSTGRPYAPARTLLKLGTHELTVVGVTTDAVSTFRAAVRADLDMTAPGAWAREHLAAALREATLPVVMSHSGLRADREILPLVPSGALVLGAHDHLRLVHRDGDTVYVHSGSWLGTLSIASLTRRGEHLRWEVVQESLGAESPADADMAGTVRATYATHLLPDEKAVVGRTTQALSAAAAAAFALDAARRAVGADAAILGATAFGGGLPRGDVTRHTFDGCVRFDGRMAVAEVTGKELRRILARANQPADLPLAERADDNLIAVGVRREDITDDRKYLLATSDRVAASAKRYLGADLPFTTRDDARLKATVLKALAASN